MPRSRRVPDPAIPTTSLVASSYRYSGKTARIYQQSTNWQREAYRHYAICGEARYGANYFGHAMSKAVLGVGQYGKSGSVDPVLTGPSVEYLNALFNGREGQAAMLSAIGVHLTIAGECYLVGRQIEGVDVWEIVSVLEMKVTGTTWTIEYTGSGDAVELTDEDVVIRIWVPSPGKRMEADSPFRSLLPILSEIEWLTRHIFAQVSSRLAGAGILLLPQSMTFPKPPAVNGVEQQYANDAEGFMLTLADGMLTPISDPSSPAALVPIVITAPDEAIDKARLMHFWSELDAASLEMRSEAIRRFAIGMDLPPEQILGISSAGGDESGSVSHWGAWQIEEDTIKMHIEPMLELVANAVTINYLRPMTDGDEIVTWNTAALRLRPDRSKESIELYDRGLISKATVIRENGFSVEDEMDVKEFKIWLLTKIASGSATPEQVQVALSMLGVDLGPTALPDSEPRESRPDPSVSDHPTRRMPERAAGLLMACDALVMRALERAGNRLRSNTGSSPANCPAYSTHTLVRSKSATVDQLLEDAWTTAPRVLDGVENCEQVVAALDGYTRMLLVSRTEHEREALSAWLERAL